MLPFARAVKKLQVRRHPFAEAAHAGLLVDQRLPAQALARLLDVADITGLIARPPAVEADRNRRAVQLAQEFAELRPDRQRVPRTAADVEHLSRHAIDAVGGQA